MIEHDPHKRIQELEAKVGELQRQLESLRTSRSEVRGTPLDVEEKLQTPVAGGNRYAWFLAVFLLAAVAGAARVELSGESGAGPWETGRVAYLGVTYTLLALGVFGALAWALLVARRHMLSVTLGMLAIYFADLTYFHNKPNEFLGSANKVFLWSAGFLTICYLLSTSACICDIRMIGRIRRRIALLAFLNSAAYGVIVWTGLRRQYPGTEWLFWLMFAGVLASCTMLAETSGPRRNYLFQVFAAKTVIVATWALAPLLPQEGLMPAMAIECLVLAVAYRRTGVVAFKVLNLVLLIVTFVGCIAEVRVPGAIVVGPYTLRANWCQGGSVSALFFVIAWFYERFGRRMPPELRRRSGQWFLADTVVDVPNATASMLHAGAGAVVLATLTILDSGERLSLPLLLALESVAIVLSGGLARTPQIQVGGVLLVAAAHVSYYFLFTAARLQTEPEQHFMLYMVLVGLYTYVAGYFWERYLRRIRGGGPWGHHAAAALPHVAATCLLADVVLRRVEAFDGAVAMNTFALALIALGNGLRLPSVKMAGLAGIVIGSWMFARGLGGIERTCGGQPAFLRVLGLFLATYVAAEQLMGRRSESSHGASRIAPAVQTIVIVCGATLGAAALHEWSRDGYATFWWLSLAGLCVLLSEGLRARRYSWAALLIVGAASIRAYRHDLAGFLPAQKLVLFAAVLAGVVSISSVCSRLTRKLFHSSYREQAEESASHE